MGPRAAPRSPRRQFHRRMTFCARVLPGGRGPRYDGTAALSSVSRDTYLPRSVASEFVLVAGSARLRLPAVEAGRGGVRDMECSGNG